MNLKEQRAAAFKAAEDIYKKAVAENRDLTTTEQVAFDAKCEDVRALDKRIKAAEEGQAAIKALADIGDAVYDADGNITSSGSGTKGRLDLGNLTERMVKGMTAESARGA
ncbi:hypothetical protein NKG05_26080 [Oerskovia sp. M15]